MASSVVMITGGSSGIGAACAKTFVDAGWRVAVVALPSDHLFQMQGPSILAIAGDITCAQVRSAAVKRTLARFSRIDALINNAGVGLYALPSEVRVDDFARVLDVNVVAPLALTQLVLPVMREQRSGSLVTVGSVCGRVSLPWAAGYSASKFALEAIHEALRREVRGENIHLLNVRLGIVDTNFREHALAGVAPDAVRNIKKVVSPEAVAAAILRGVRQRRKTVYVPEIGRIFTLLESLAPSVMDRFLSRYMPGNRSFRPETISAVRTS